MSNDRIFERVPGPVRVRPGPNGLETSPVSAGRPFTPEPVVAATRMPGIGTSFALGNAVETGALVVR